MDERPPTIIIKRVKKVQGGGHGGSWKVAYADFMTAMMAFFLLLWLLSMVSDEKRAAVSEYFRRYSIFQESGTTAITTKNAKITDPQFMNEAGSESDVKSSRYTGKIRKVGDVSFKHKQVKKQDLDKKSDELANKIRGSVDKKMAGVRDQILVDVIEGGIRIQIIDTEGSVMFQSGSAQPTPKAKEILKLVSSNVQEMPGQIVVEGHTDSAPFKGGQITNWELSTSRASAARKELEENGIAASRIARVVGYADTELLIPLDPLDPRNRRISVIILQEQK